MKLLHVVPTYLPAYGHGGPIHSVHGLCRTLVARGHRVTVYTTDVHGPDRLDVPLSTPVDRDGVEVLYFPVPRRGPAARIYRTAPLGAALRETTPDFDLVHLHSIFLWPTSAAARAAHRAGVPYLLAPRGMMVPELIAERGRLRKTLWLRSVGRRTIKHAAALHVTTKLEARDAERFGLELPPVRVVPNGIDLEPFQRPSAPPDTLDGTGPGAKPPRPPLRVLALGRVSWKKGLDRLIHALAHLEGGPGRPEREIALTIAGPDEDGHRGELETLTSRLGLAEQVEFLGPVHGADKIRLLRTSDALALPSRSENFANVVLEAMAAGTAVVVTPEVGLADVVEQGGCGLVVAGDPESLAAALAELAADPAAAHAMGERGAAAAESFSWPAVAGHMEEVYRGVLELCGRREA